MFLIVNTYWTHVDVHFIGWEESVADEKITENGQTGNFATPGQSAGWNPSEATHGWGDEQDQSCKCGKWEVKTGITVRLFILNRIVSKLKENNKFWNLKCWEVK